MKIIVTGGIGSGKSTVCELLKKEFGCEMQYLSVDSMVASLYGQANIKQQLIKSFGTCSKSEISKIVFADVRRRLDVELIFAAPIREQILFNIGYFENFILEFPLLTKYGKDLLPMVDFVINVESFLSLRVNRIMARDNRTKEEAKTIIKAQPRDSERRKISDFIIENNEERGNVEENVKQTVIKIKGTMQCLIGCQVL